MFFVVYAFDISGPARIGDPEPDNFRLRKLALPPPLFVDCGIWLGLVPLLEVLFAPTIFLVDEFFSILKLLVVGIIFILVFGRPT